MFTQRVLEEVRNPELRKILFSKGKDKESRLQWIRDKIKNLHFPKRKGTVDVSGSLQQSDLLREFYLAIAENGLQYTFDNANQYLKPGDLPVHINSLSGKVDNSDKHVIIVGAGMSGLVAAYELAKERYSVEILEMSQRFGGRVKTFTQKDGFDRGLHSDGEYTAGSTCIITDRPRLHAICGVVHLWGFYTYSSVEIICCMWGAS